MGLRFRKSIKIAPGIRLNIGKKSSGISFGKKGLRFSANTSGRKTMTMGLPGTGLSYTKTFQKQKSSTANHMNNKRKESEENKMKKSNTNTKNNKPLWGKWWFWLVLLCLVAAIFPSEESEVESPESSSVLETGEVVAQDDEPIEIVPEIVFDEQEEEVQTEEDVTNTETEEPIVEAPVAEDPTIIAPVVEEQKEELPVIEEPKEEPPVIEVPETEPPVVEEPVVQEPVESQPVQAEPVGQIVYITETGSKYHRGSCRHLSNSKIEISLENAKVNYEPCGTCKP